MHALKIAWNKFEKAVVPTFSRLVTNSINTTQSQNQVFNLLALGGCGVGGGVEEYRSSSPCSKSTVSVGSSVGRHRLECVCVDLCCALVSGLCQPNQRLLRSRPLLEGRGSLPWRTLCGVVSTEIVLLWWDRRMALLLVLISFFSNYKTSFYGEIFSNAAKWCQDWFGLVMSTKKELKLSNKW